MKKTNIDGQPVYCSYCGAALVPSGEGRFNPFTRVLGGATKLKCPLFHVGFISFLVRGTWRHDRWEFSGSYGWWKVVDV
jgi:hypothetical protein